MKKSAEELKEIVKEKYSMIARGNGYSDSTSCCSSSSCCNDDYTVFSEDYTTVAGYNPDADLGLGCGLPVEHSGIRIGDTVVDLGSGAGNDCFVARSVVGDAGRVIGIDMTPDMIDKARKNNQKLGYTNVEFLLGDIENIPLDMAVADVVVSNCVLNLVPDKARAFSEIFRVLKKGGHFTISDVVIEGALPGDLHNEAELYAGCVTGAIPSEEYLGVIESTGFENIIVHKKREILLPDELLLKYLLPVELAAFKDSGAGIYSITVSATRPDGCGSNCSCHS
jgi:arsenite methyltransferase